MIESTRSVGDSSWDSHRQTNRVGGIVIRDVDIHGSLTTKQDDKVNISDASGEVNMHENSYLNEFEYTPTPFNPRRVSRCRLENLVILATLIVMFVLSVFALVTPLFYYRSSTATVRINSVNFWGSGGEGVQQRYNVHTIFCENYATKSDGYLALYILLFLIVCVGFLLSLFPIICGRVLICTYLVHTLLILCWFFLLVAMILGVLMYRGNLCHNTSLKNIGFRYGPAFGLTAALFSLLSITMIFLVLRAIKNPL
ncbi:conserved hypothetical protein [Leishmania major strain Friedlin]|uniref:Amastin-like protein n=1 Tax=Leishmania major TaxID=5664 RepID=Q4Q8F4_LEIMA|nr:conserved hypothetical protein [Leishmania major strain Friedlin]CAG9577219.1 hypothetical_protein_-_conserved [Leishmania major strain Friedlin]CAJ05293.1 conserved hypothetical protein [Leishmania major strain Friedlin]|eukprot:XP_001684394.1 conserved hypothetical protein [Leishmania major strain Friedlin]